MQIEDVDHRYRRAPALLVEWRGRDTLVVDCTTMRRVRIDAQLVQVLARLDEWTSFDDLVASGIHVSRGALERLVAARLLEQAAPADALPARDRCDPRVVWNPYELAVQRNGNRGGLRAAPLDCEAPPLRRTTSAVHAPLPPPAAALPGSLSDVLESRRSVRRYASRPLTVEELSTLLHHAARVVRERPAGRSPTEALRPFAGAGGRSELEIYVVAESIGSIAPGVYRYDAFAHHLAQVRTRDAAQERFLRDVSSAAGGLERVPPVALLITAVFGRIMQRYEGIGLSLIYEDCGCLIQTLYLVATAMGLAPCAIGAGRELENSRWLGLDPMIEAPVGCMLIGPLPAAHDEVTPGESGAVGVAAAAHASHPGTSSTASRRHSAVARSSTIAVPRCASAVVPVSCCSTVVDSTPAAMDVCAARKLSGSGAT